MKNWKEIPNFNGRYILSDKGQIYDIKRSKEIKHHMSGVKRRNYKQVSLCKIVEGKSKRFTKRVHSLMAVTYLNHVYGNRSVVVDHIDNNPLNNDLKNLQIITNKQNCLKDRKN